MSNRRGFKSFLAGFRPPVNEKTNTIPSKLHHKIHSTDVLDGPKLNLGSGHDNKVGWINIDIHERHHPDIVADVTKLISINDNYAAYALAQDILEHIGRDTVMTALQQWNRVLLPQG